jgi:hypothetical protein
MAKLTGTARENSYGEKSPSFGSEFNTKQCDVMEIFKSTYIINISHGAEPFLRRL